MPTFSSEAGPSEEQPAGSGGFWNSWFGSGDKKVSRTHGQQPFVYTASQALTENNQLRASPRFSSHLCVRPLQA